MKFFFNTKSFTPYYDRISVTDKPQDADILVLGSKTVAVEDFVKLKAVYRFGVGKDNVPFAALKERGIPVFFPSDKTKEVRNLL